MARQKGLEPLAYCLEGSCSIQLSYWRIKSGAGDGNRTRIPSLEGWCPGHCATPACALRKNRQLRYINIRIPLLSREKSKFSAVFCRLYNIILSNKWGAVQFTPCFLEYSITACLNRMSCVIFFIANRVAPAFRFCFGNSTLAHAVPIHYLFLGFVTHHCTTCTGSLSVQMLYPDRAAQTKA